MQTWPGATGSGQGLGLVASAIGLQRERPVWRFRGEHNARGLAREALMTPAVQWTPQALWASCVLSRPLITSGPPASLVTQPAAR